MLIKNTFIKTIVRNTSLMRVEAYEVLHGYILNP